MQSTDGFSPKKPSAAARKGYLIVRICLLEALSTCWRYGDSEAVRLAKESDPTVSPYDRCCQPSVYGLGNGDSFAVPSAIKARVLRGSHALAGEDSSSGHSDFRQKFFSGLWFEFRYVEFLTS